MQKTNEPAQSGDDMLSGSTKVGKKDVRKYELMVVIKATLPDAQRKAALKKIKDTLVSQGGRIEEENIWGKRYMAYPILKHSEGYYLVYNISLPSESAVEFKRLMNIDSNVLRHLLRSVSKFEKITEPSEGDKTITETRN